MTGYEAALSAAALLHRSWREIVGVGGEERAAFLERILSNEIEALATGEGCRALLLDGKGHVVVDLDVWVADEDIFLGCAAAAAEMVVTTLRRYVLGSPVKIEALGGEVEVLAIVGPRADEVVRAVGAGPPPSRPHAHVCDRLAGSEVRLARAASLAAPGVEIHAPVAAVNEVRNALEAALPDAGAVLADEAAEVLRIEAGVPRFAAELTGSEFPQEALLDGAVSYEKGCFLGQETVARIHYRGQVNRLLRGLRCERLAQPGAELIASGRRIGAVTSAAVSPRFGSIGLGYVRRDAEAGTEAELRVESRAAGNATVVDLPFAG